MDVPLVKNWQNVHIPEKITGLRLPAVRRSLKTRPRDGFRYNYTKITSFEYQASIAQMIERRLPDCQIRVRFPSSASTFFFIVED